MSYVFEEQYGKKDVEFCRYAFGITSDMLTEAEKKVDTHRDMRFQCYK